jgi:hypothetical protein
MIHHSTIPYSFPIVMVMKKEVNFHTCLNFCNLKNLIVKEKFPITIIDDLLEEIHGAWFFTKLDLSLIYNQI